MAGFLFSEFANTQITTATTTNLFTVTALHSFVIKYALIEHTEVATALGKTFFLELSDTAGANFIKVSEEFTTTAAASSFIVNLTPTNVDLPDPTLLLTFAAVNQKEQSLSNATLKAGQILRIITAGTYAGADTTSVLINGIDHTE